MPWPLLRRKAAAPAPVVTSTATAAPKANDDGGGGGTTAVAFALDPLLAFALMQATHHAAAAHASVSTQAADTANAAPAGDANVEGGLALLCECARGRTTAGDTQPGPGGAAQHMTELEALTAYSMLQGKQGTVHQAAAFAQ